MSFLLSSRPVRFAAQLAANATDTSFASVVPTTTEPTGTGVVSMTPNSPVPTNVVLLFYGAGSDNQTYDARVIGWRQTVDTTTATPRSEWIPVPLLQVSCTLCATTGAANGLVGTGNRLVDTVTVSSTVTAGTVGVDYTISSPGNDLAAQVLLDLKGCTKFQIIYDMTGATSGNCLYAFL